jgi:hypothetical protein
MHAKGISAHQDQIRAWKASYSWASDANGVRHGSQVIPNVDQRTAKYTLITASAFVSYLIDASREAGVSL